jgi:hypothetical protein
MHNIETPELPSCVKDARDQFFHELQVKNGGPIQNAGNRGGSSQQTGTKKAIVKQKASEKTETLKSLERAQVKNQLH